MKQVICKSKEEQCCLTVAQLCPPLTSHRSANKSNSNVLPSPACQSWHASHCKLSQSERHGQIFLLTLKWHPTARAWPGWLGYNYSCYCINQCFNEWAYTPSPTHTHSHLTHNVDHSGKIIDSDEFRLPANKVYGKQVQCLNIEMHTCV